MFTTRFHALTFALVLATFAEGTARAAQPDDKATDLVPRDALVIPPVGRYGRSAIHLDAVEALIVAGKWQTPKADDQLQSPNGAQTWRAAAFDGNGRLNHKALVGGYAVVPLKSDAERVMILEASGHGMVHVNGEPRTGDPYATGYVRLPVRLKKGDNELIFHAVRGFLQVRLKPVTKDAELDTRDLLMPDWHAGKQRPTWGAVVVRNNRATPLTNLLLAVDAGLPAATITKLAPLPPFSVRKIGFALPAVQHDKTGEVEVKVALSAEGTPGPLDTATVKVRVRAEGQTYKETFISAIDGSVQYYAVNPARPLRPDAPRPALFLSLHGASVEAIGQAEAYGGKTWGHVVAPTNRRPFGFDWEDWGRLDALEVLTLAQKQLGTDPRRTYLTGHSMGGHGVWHVGANFPDRFAAIGPSAGWVAFWTYAGMERPQPDSPVKELMQRATNPSDTLGLAKNFAQHGVYVLHGDADDNVPVGQARLMRQKLSEFHKNFLYHEQPKAGHWWDVSKEPGADCVDWAPMFDFFARQIVPDNESVRHVRFTTANPGISAKSHWVSVLVQQRHGKFSSVDVRHDVGLRRFTGTTDNVARLALDLGHVRPGDPLTVELDGTKIEDIAWPKGEARLHLLRSEKGWEVTGPPAPSAKGPHRYGPFRDAFRNRMVLVYGTQGSAAENAWAFAKARYDAETFWYRGNGSVDVVSDAEFLKLKEPDRNVIVYGNAQTNAAWDVLLKDSPVQVRRVGVTVGDRTLTGDDLACLLLRPRPGSDVACVGVVAGTGLAGMRLTDRVAYFVSGVGMPDCLVLGPEMLAEGYGGVRAAGYFGGDWSVVGGEFAWKQ
jgi:dienelactone hydrolase